MLAGSDGWPDAGDAESEQTGPSESGGGVAFPSEPGGGHPTGQET